MGISFGGTSALVTPRSDIGLGFDEIDLEALRGGYVGFQIAPIIEAQVAFGQFKKLKLAQALQPRITTRDSNGGFKRIDAEFDVDTFQTVDHGLEMRVDNRDSAMYAAMIDSEMVAGELTRHGVIEGHEQRVIALIDAMGVTASANEFDDSAADLVADFNAYRQTFRLACGFPPNAMCLDLEIANRLFENASILELFVGASARTPLEIRLQGLAAALGLEEIIVSNSVKNTVAAPKAFSLAATWPVDKALLFRKSTAATTLVPQFMRTIHWSGNGSRPGCSFEEYEEPQTDGHILRHRLDVQEKIIYSSMAMVINNVKT